MQKMNLNSLLNFGWLVALTMLFGVIGTANLYAQSVRVSGQVNDASGQPLVGATVVEVGTTNGSLTNDEGAFSLEAGSRESVLRFTYIGMEPIEMVVGDRSTFDITLKAMDVAAEEVVIVGYGAQKKINLSGAVDQIEGEAIERRPVSNLSQALQGVSPNLNITMPSGEPGAAAQFNIRGFTSINGGQPLIIVDGVPFNPEDLNFLNPNDIASVSVLKDASSAAIYGARAAFGVVVITTKSGDRDRVSYSSNYLWGRPTVVPDPVTDPYIFLRMIETSTDNTPWDYKNFTPEQYEWARQRSDDPSVEDVRLDPNNPNQWAYMGNTNWNDYFFNETAFSQNQNMSISGSTDEVRYFISGNYAQDNGLSKLAEDNWERYAMRSKVMFTPFKWLNVENNTQLFQVVRNSPNTNLTDIYNFHPVDVAVNPDGTWANTPAGRKAAQLTDGGRYQNKDYGFNTITRANLILFDGLLTLTGDATFRRNYNQTHADWRRYLIGYGPEDIREEGGNTYASETFGVERYNAFNVYGTLAEDFGKHSVSVILGYNQESYETESLYGRRDQLISPALPYIGLAYGDQFADYYGTDWAVRGVFGRANYIYDSRYILEFNGRYDGSSRFPSDARYGFFPSVSAGWVVSEESFMESASFLSTLKLRASYGSLGNQAVSNYGYILTMPSYTTGYLIDGNFQRAVGAPGLNVDPENYTWEVVNSTDIGVDFGLFDGRIFGSFDYYIRNTNGMLTQGAELPGVLGTSEPQANAADLQTKGWDGVIGFTNTATVAGQPFAFTIRGVISDARTFITDFENEDQLLSQYRVGQEIGEIWGLESNGYFTSQEEIDALNQTAIIPWGALEITEGWPKFVDQNGDGAIMLGQTAENPEDLKVIGNSQARYQFGTNVSMEWAGVDLSFFIQGVGKRQYYPTYYLFWGPYQQPYANTYDHLMDYYRASDDDATLMAQHSQAYIDAGLANANTDNPEFPHLQAWLADYRVNGGLATPQTKYLLNAGYARLKNVTLGYTLPERLTQRVRISRLRFYVSGENLFEISEIKDFVDPEAIEQSFGGYAYPFQRRYAFGVNLDF